MKEKANFLYQKGSHYISGTFLAVGIIISILNGFSYFVPFMILAILLEPLQLGVVRACLKAYDRRAKEVSTTKYTLMGLKEYPSAFSIFVGKRLVVLFIQALILLGFTFLFSGTIDNVIACLKTLVTGNTQFIVQTTSEGFQWQVAEGLIIGQFVALVVGIILDIKFALCYYFAVDQDYSLFESLSASWKALKGKTFKYIGLLLRFALPYIGAMIAIYLTNMALSNGFMQMMEFLPAMRVPLAAVLTILVAAASTTFSVMIYQVKLQLAITVFYKESIKDQK